MDIEDLTIERAHGETYHDDRTIVLYGHGVYPESSVLAGQDSRVYLASWTIHDSDGLYDNDASSVEDAVAKARAYAAEHHPGLPIADLTSVGTTHVPVDQVVAHLPDDEG